MVGTLIKQPNEKYCIINYSGDVVRYNLTEQDIINMYIDEAKDRIENSEHFGNIIAKTVKEYSGKADSISDNVLKEMGFDKSYDELIKFIPRKPIDTSYAPCDFTTYGKCPNCGERVENCMGHFEEKCRNCGQLLKW
jgi:hypothetical protein